MDKYITTIEVIFKKHKKIDWLQATNELFQVDFNSREHHRTVSRNNNQKLYNSIIPFYLFSGDGKPYGCLFLIYMT